METYLPSASWKIRHHPHRPLGHSRHRGVLQVIHNTNLQGLRLEDGRKTYCETGRQTAKVKSENKTNRVCKNTTVSRARRQGLLFILPFLTIQPALKQHVAPPASCAAQLAAAPVTSAAALPWHLGTGPGCASKKILLCDNCSTQNPPNVSAQALAAGPGASPLASTMLNMSVGERDDFSPRQHEPATSKSLRVYSTPQF